MRGPITWRNVESPDFSRGNLISSGVADIQSGLEGLQNILGTQARQQQQTWQQGKEANTINALNQINQLRSVDALNNTQAGDLINPYGAQVNAQAVMDALKGQRGVIANEMQTEDAINGYTEKAKYGPIADQAALLIQQGRTKEAAPLLEQLKGTSYAKELGGMVQQLDWHNQDQRLKQRELDIQAARFAQEKAAKNAIDIQDAATSNAAREVATLVSSGKATPQEAVALMIQKYGQAPGVDPIKLTQNLNGYTKGFELPDANKEVIKQFNVGVEDLNTKVGRTVQQAKDTVAQQVGYNPAMDAQIAQAGKMNKEVLIGDKSGQITKATLDDLDRQLSAEGEAPLTTGEIAYVIQNRTKSFWPMADDTYSVADILQQRRAKAKYDVQVRGINDLHNKWQKDFADNTKNQVATYAKESRAPSVYDPTASVGKLNAGLQDLSKQYAAFEQSLVPITNAQEREQQDAAKIQATQEQNKTLIDQLKQLSNENALLKSPAAIQQGMREVAIARQQEAKAKQDFANNYRPKGNEDWEKIRTYLLNNVGNPEDREFQIRSINSAIDAAKNGDTRVYSTYRHSIMRYASSLYEAQKAGKK